MQYKVLKFNINLTLIKKVQLVSFYVLLQYNQLPMEFSPSKLNTRMYEQRMSDETTSRITRSLVTVSSFILI